MSAISLRVSALDLLEFLQSAVACAAAAYRTGEHASQHACVLSGGFCTDVAFAICGHLQAGYEWSSGGFDVALTHEPAMHHH